MCLPIGSMLLRSKILWMKHVVFWREPDGIIPRATGDWLTGRWDSRKVLRHCHNTWKTSTYARRCWSSRFWHSDWKSGLFPDFYRKYSKVRTFPGPGGQQLKIRTFPGNKDPWEPWRLYCTLYAVSRTVSYTNLPSIRRDFSSRYSQWRASADQSPCVINRGHPAASNPCTSCGVVQMQALHLDCYAAPTNTSQTVIQLRLWSEAFVDRWQQQWQCWCGNCLHSGTRHTPGYIDVMVCDRSVFYGEILIRSSSGSSVLARFAASLGKWFVCTQHWQAALLPLEHDQAWLKKSWPLVTRSGGH